MKLLQNKFSPIPILLLTVFVSFQLFAHEEGKNKSTSEQRARIKPTIINLELGETQQYFLVKAPPRLGSPTVLEEIEWSVNGIIGGNNTFGTITELGKYTAPSKISGSTEIQICAVTKEAKNNLLWATVLLKGKTPEYKTVKTWGEDIDELKYFKSPTSLAFSKDDDILITDYNVKRFTRDGKYISEFGEKRGDIENSFVNPQTVVVDSDGNIFVSDLRTGPPRIQKFTNTGEYLYGFAPKGTRENRVMDTKGIAIDSQQHLYVGDIDNMRVSKFETSGKFIKIIGKKGIKPGEFNLPSGVAVDPNDELFVSSYFGPCQKLSSDGKYLSSFAYPNPPEGAVHFLDIAADKWGNVYIIVKGISKLDGSLNPLIDKNQ